MNTKRMCPNCGKALAPDAPEDTCPECLIRAGFATEEDSLAEPNAPAASDFTPPLVEQLSSLFPQLEIGSLLGRGGMGAVYRARQPALDRSVALKILPAQSTAKPGFAERFNREARALARLNHPHIVSVYDFGQAGGIPYFIMELVDGPSLRQLEQQGRLAPDEALAIVPQICDALQYAHDEGVVHRDIKPENVLLDRRGRVKIADFGIAKIMGRDGGQGTLTQDRQVIGTPHYMAPEQVESPQRVDHRADIFSLGVVFYELLTGELPLGKFPPPSQKAAVDTRLDQVVLRALEKKPERRYQHASEVKTALETLAKSPEPVEGKNPGLAKLLKIALGCSLFVVVMLLTLLGVNFFKAPAKSGNAPNLNAAPVLLTPPAVVIQTIPQSGVANVDPGLNEIRVTFSKPMQDGSWSWSTWGEGTYPELSGTPRYEPDARTCVLPVKLQPGKFYALWINTEQFQNFRDRDGLAAVPYLLVFQTRK